MTGQFSRSKSAAVCFCFVVVLAISPISLLQGQEASAGAAHEHDHGEPSEAEMQKMLENQRIEPEREEFRIASDALREHLKAMREQVVRFHVAMSKDSVEHRNEFVGMIEESYQLHQKMLGEALIEFKQGGKNKDLLAAMFVRVLDREMKKDRHEGLLPIALALAESGFEQQKLQAWIVELGTTMNEYDIVEKYIDSVIIGAPENRLYPAIKQNLPLLKQRWAAELAARERDASGEPLPVVVIETSKGFVEIELFENQAPDTVGNFINLVESGFYDGLDFHTVLDHFAAQGGCPTRDGKGNPGYTIFGEAAKPEARRSFRGSIGMALSGDDPNTAGSQFFITFLPVWEQDGLFTFFGRVTKGMHVISSLQRVDANKKKDEKEKSAEDVPPDDIRSIKVLRKREHPYEPNIAARVAALPVVGEDDAGGAIGPMQN